MTIEEAIKEIKEASDSEVRYGDKEHHYNEVMKRVEAFDMAIQALEQQPCENAISRQAVLMEIDKYLCGVPFLEKGIDVVIKELPPVTPTKAELWSRLYIWLNDMHLGISPDEFTPDDERKRREAQTDIIEDIMGWIEANVFEPKAGSEGNA